MRLPLLRIGDETECLVGLVEFEQLFPQLQPSRPGSPGTIRRMRYAGKLPDEDLVVSGSPIWRLSTIQKWATETGRPITLPSPQEDA